MYKNAEIRCVNGAIIKRNYVYLVIRNWQTYLVNPNVVQKSR